MGTRRKGILTIPLKKTRRAEINPLEFFQLVKINSFYFFLAVTPTTVESRDASGIEDYW